MNNNFVELSLNEQINLDGGINGWNVAAGGVAIAIGIATSNPFDVLIGCALVCDGMGW